MRFCLTLALSLLICESLHAQSPWKRHIIDDSSKGADGIRLTDFDRDGRLDVVTGWEQGNVSRVYLQPEMSDVKMQWPAVTVGPATSVEDAVAVDLDGDGAMDVVSSTEGKSRTLYVHWSPKKKDDLLKESAWRTEAIPDSINAQSWMFCLPIQVDGKRGIDLVTGSKGKNAAVGWWESPADPRKLSDWKFHRLADAGWIMSLFARDVDLDGDMDIVFTDRKGKSTGLKWLELRDKKNTHSSAGWKEHVIGADGKEVMFAALNDIDGDGAEDIAVITRNGTTDLFRRIPKATPPKWKSYSISNPVGYAHGKSITIADFDNDGDADLAMTLRSVPKDAPAVFVLQHDGNPFGGKWTAADIGGPDGSKFDLIEAIDLDQDGDLDLLTCEEVADLGVFWYENPRVVQK